ncbi:MAG: polymer-forming cytoskeletal protein [Deinococcales bacterium]
MSLARRTYGRVAALVVLAVCALAASQGVPGGSVQAPGVVVGGSYEVTSGQTVVGDLTAVGATVVIEPGGTLEGHLITIGGSTVVDGLVTGDVHAYGGALTLGAASRVRGDVGAFYAAFEPVPGSVVEGTTEAGNEPPVQFSLPENIRVPTDVATRVAVSRNPADGVLRSIGLGLVAALLMAAIPLRVGRVRDTMLRRPGRAGLDGLLTLLVVLILLVLVALTIIGIPLAIVGGMALYATVLFGWIALGDAVGSYLATSFKQTWSPPLRAGIGVFSLSLALLILNVIPVLGALLGFLLGLVALGAVRMTRFGAREPRRRTPAAPTPQGG